MLRWFTQLRLAQKFLLLGAIVLSMMAFPTVLYLQSTVTNVRQAQRQAEGMPAITALHTIVEHLQVHRGLSSGMLGGSKEMGQRRLGARDAVNRALNQAQDILVQTQAPQEQQESLRTLQRKWQELEQIVAGGQIQMGDSFARHTDLVFDVMLISEDLLVAYGLQASNNMANAALLQATLVHAPMLGEMVAQMRGMGAGLLAKAFVSVDERGRFQTLVSRTAELQQQAGRAIRRAMALNPEYAQALGDEVRTVAQRLGESVELARGEVLEVDLLQYPATDYFDKLTAAIESVNTGRVHGAELLTERLTADARHQRNQLVGLVVALSVSLAVVVALALLFIRSITTPLRHAIQLAESVARGDLSGQDVPTDRSEVGELIAAQQQMRARLRPVIAQVRQSAHSVALASAEIAQGNQDLSGRTESQASALEQTAASMEELSATVRHNADNAQQAHQLSVSAQSVVREGGQVVGQVVQTMQGIHDSSRRMSDIIGVIDGIAFQTNILALNAAVEAARAGEQGRGFAVVAGEVRSLAQRSAEAAKEIKQLIADSVRRMDEGNALAHQAGNTMQEVEAAIEKVNTIVSAISSASQEQASGVAQVGEAITHMDHATQQNAALVEQMAAAAASLSNQSQELVRAVSVFREDGCSDIGFGRQDSVAQQSAGALAQPASAAVGRTSRTALPR